MKRTLSQSSRNDSKHELCKKKNKTTKHELCLTSLIPKGIEFKTSMRPHFLVLQIIKYLTKFIHIYKGSGKWTLIHSINCSSVSEKHFVNQSLRTFK